MFYELYELITRFGKMVTHGREDGTGAALELYEFRDGDFYRLYRIRFDKHGRPDQIRTFDGKIIEVQVRAQEVRK